MDEIFDRLFGGSPMSPNAMTGTATNYEDRSITFEDIKRVFNELMREPPPAAVLRFIESDMAVRLEPRRKHVRRRNQTAQYHIRVQKKWTKRFGRVSVPTMFIVNGSLFGTRDQVALIHPTIYAQLKQLPVPELQGDPRDRPAAIGPASAISGPFSIPIKWAT